MTQATGHSLFREPEAVLFVFLQNDPDKEYNMPKDGTVHELTSNVGVTQTLLERCEKASSSGSGDTATVGPPPGWPRAPGLHEQALVVKGYIRHTGPLRQPESRDDT